jgi:hypothetical protein
MPSKLTICAASALCVALIGTVIARSYDPSAYNHDIGWLLYSGGRLLDGDRLYVDLVDENPPLIFWLSAVPVAISRLVGPPPILIFNLLVALLASISCAISYRVLRFGWPSAPPTYHTTLIGLVAYLELIAPGYDFGQRENLLFTLLVPYLFAAASRAAGRPVPNRAGLAIGLFAALGLALKAFFIVAWIAIELWIFVGSRERWRCAENAAIAAFHVVYLGLLLMITPEYLDVVAMSAQVLMAYRTYSSLDLLLLSAVLHVVCAAGLVALTRSNALDRELRRVLLVAALSLFVSALLQGTDWSYHYAPSNATAILLMSVTVLGLAFRTDSFWEALRPKLASLPLIVLVLLTSWSVVGAVRATLRVQERQQWEETTLIGALTSIVNEQAWRGPIWVMSSDVIPAFPLVNLSRARWSSRFCAIWLLPGLYTEEEKAAVPFRYREPQEMGELERYVIDTVIEDLRADMPSLIIVDGRRAKQAWGETDFEFLPYFTRDERFDAIFREYRRITDVGKFRVYKRRQYPRRERSQ